MSNVSFGRITLDSEVIPGPDAKYVYSAMNNMDKAIHAVCLVGTRVTTLVSTEILANSYPPSVPIFSSESMKHFQRRMMLWDFCPGQMHHQW